jgi:hypothetical protein
MERAPDKLPNTSSRLIAMAVSLVGEADQVRQAMQCSNEDFREYCAASKEPPGPEFDRLIQLIIREQGKMLAKNRELIGRIREAQSKPK